MRLLVIAMLAGCGGGGSAAQDTETACDDGVDNDDDGATDCDDDTCAADPSCQVPAGEVCATVTGADEDSDGLVDCEDDDCFDDPACYTHDDPTDLPGPDGDPSVDLDKIHVDLTGGVATFFATTDGTWPPPAGTYSWFIQFEIDNDGYTPLAAAVISRHDGVDEVDPFGVPLENVTVRQTPAGIWVRITGVPAGGVMFYVESGIQKTYPGTRVTDVLGSAPMPLP